MKVLNKSVQTLLFDIAIPASIFWCIFCSPPVYIDEFICSLSESRTAGFPVIVVESLSHSYTLLYSNYFRSTPWFLRCEGLRSRLTDLFWDILSHWSTLVQTASERIVGMEEIVWNQHRTNSSVPCCTGHLKIVWSTFHLPLHPGCISTY